MASLARVVLAFALALVAGWAGYQVWERTRGVPTVTPQAAAPVGSGHAHLERGELDAAARSFAAAGDRWGQVMVAVERADAAWRAWRFGGRSPEALEELDHRVDDARHAIAELLLDCPDPARCAEGRVHARRLNVLLVAAFHDAGLDERARGALSARLGDSPEGALLRRHIAGPAGSAAAVASAAPSASSPAGPPTERPPPPYAAPEEHFEFEEEPPVTPATPGELELPLP